MKAKLIVELRWVLAWLPLIPKVIKRTPYTNLNFVKESKLLLLMHTTYVSAWATAGRIRLVQRCAAS